MNIDKNQHCEQDNHIFCDLKRVLDYERKCSIFLLEQELSQS
jgi:hypothetical protein